MPRPRSCRARRTHGSRLRAGIRVMFELASDDSVFCDWVNTTDEEPPPNLTSVEKTFVKRPVVPRGVALPPLRIRLGTDSHAPVSTLAQD